ncbi:MAG: hypothetical protein QOJ58_1594, partial [Alphaproteobacteria bacterium]|nr:hypothetical protein [Alphaproteobacteria bacterium]
MPNPNGSSPNFGSAFNCPRSISVTSGPVSTTFLGSQNNCFCFLPAKTALAHLMPLYVFPKMSSHTLRLSESAKSYSCNADFTSYSAIAVVTRKSRLPSRQTPTPAMRNGARAIFPLWQRRGPLRCPTSSTVLLSDGNSNLLKKLRLRIAKIGKSTSKIYFDMAPCSNNAALTAPYQSHCTDARRRLTGCRSQRASAVIRESSARPTQPDAVYGRSTSDALGP